MENPHAIATQELLVWALTKHDLGTATGLGGMIFGVEGTSNALYDKCYRRQEKGRDLELDWGTHPKQLTLMDKAD